MSKKRKAILKQMWINDPHCRKCGVLTILREDLPKTCYPDQLATFDHVFSKLNPNRYKKGGKKGQLYCLKCNTEKNDYELKNIPKEVLVKMSKNVRRKSTKIRLQL